MTNDYRSIGEPGFIAPGKACISQALEIISLLPLRNPEGPEAILRRLFATNAVPATLIRCDVGHEGDTANVMREWWQGPSADAAFKTLMVRARVIVGYGVATLPGWIVMDVGMLRRAVQPLIKRPETDKALQGLEPVRQFLAQANTVNAEKAFDEAARRCIASRIVGVAAESILALAAPVVPQRLMPAPPKPASAARPNTNVQRRQVRDFLTHADPIKRKRDEWLNMFVAEHSYRPDVDLFSEVLADFPDHKRERGDTDRRLAKGGR